MSGHSKWATTHRQKEAKDAKKGAIFTKLAANITVAVRQGGGVGDPSQNFRLRLAVDKAREVNMPKENIQRAINKGMGVGGGENLEEARFEGFLPGGAAILVDILSDNKLRTQQQVRTILEKGGGAMGQVGTVSYLFEQKGKVICNIGGKDREEAELLAIDCGAAEVDVDNDLMMVLTKPEELRQVKDNLEKAGFTIVSADLIMKPVSTVEGQSDELIEKIEEIDEVVNVWTNYA